MKPSVPAAMKRRAFVLTTGLFLGASVRMAWSQQLLPPSTGLAPATGLAPENRFPLSPQGLAPERSRQETLALLNDSRRQLAMFNSHTNELYSETFYHDSDYDAVAISAFSEFMRDWREEQVFPIDPALMDLLWALQKLVDDQPMILLSGYRTPATNAALAAQGEGVAVNSMHTQGKAADIAVDGLTAEELGAKAISLGGGGVGIYAERGFVHVDTGPVRRW